MLNNKNEFYEKLTILGLTREEAKVYTELLKEAQTHLSLSRLTGINRTKIYRLAEELVKKSLVTKETNDRGNYLVAKDPSTLGVGIANDEATLKKKRATYQSVLPDLEALLNIGGSDDLQVLTYDGKEGLKHMLWHELKTKDEILILGYGVMEDLVGKGKWAEKHRERTISAGYKIHELMNGKPDPSGYMTDFTQVARFKKIYELRYISDEILNITDNQIAIYNDTVAIYLSRGKRKVGVEIINRPYADMMRQMFNMYWKQAK